MSFEVGKPIDFTAAEQLLLRQDIIGDDYRLARPDLAYGYFFEKTPWIKLSSGVDLANNADGKRVATKLLSDPNLIGDELAKRNVLFNLTEKDLSQITAAGDFFTDIKAIAGAPIKSKGLSDLPGYELSDNYGIRPLPGILSMNLRTHNTFGSLRTATVNFVCWTVKQLEVLEVLFMRPGYTALLEWGHSRYLYKEGETIKTDPVNTYAIDFFGTNKKRSVITDLLTQQKKKYQYNYDGMYGVIKNFSWSLRPDGGYDCRIDIVSTGEIIESLKINTSLTGVAIKSIEEVNKPVAKPGPKSSEEEARKKEGEVQNFFKLSEEDKAREAKLREQTASVQDQTSSTVVAPQIASTTAINAVQESVQEVPPVSTIEGYKSLLHYILLIGLRGRINSAVAFSSKKTGYFNLDLEDYVIKEALITKDVSKIDSEYKEALYAVFDTATKSDSAQPDNELTAFYYIKLGLLLEIINSVILTSGLEDEPFFLLETDIKTFKYKTIDDHVSIDPAICILPDTVDVYVQSKNKKTRLENILEIFVNIEHVTSILNGFIDQDGEVQLYSFLETLLKDLNLATGGLNNFQLQYFEDTAKFAILDRNLVGQYAEKISQINIIGKNSIVRNFNLTSKLSPRIGHMVAVSAQASPYSTGIEATGLAFLNKGLQDRIIVERNDSQSATVKARIAQQQEKEAVDEKLIELEKLVQVQAVILQLYGKETVDGVPYYTYDESAVLAARSQYNSYIPYLLGQKNNPAYGFIIPFELELTLEGISGFRIMESFRINKQILPYTYRGTDLNDIAFLITGLEHQVNNQAWNTVVRSQLYITGNKYRTRRHVLRDAKTRPADTSTSINVKPITTAEQDARGIAIIRFFVGKGLEREQAAGFAGNFFAESGLQPNIVNSKGAYGLAQWLGKRKNNLFTLARRKGESESKVSFNTQLEFAWAELQSYEKAALNDLQTKTTVEAAAISIMNRYERPGADEKASSVNKRIAYAKRFLELYSA